MTLDAIKQAISELPDEERSSLTAWLCDREFDAWDREIEADFSAGGRGERLLDQVKASIRRGEFRPMDRGNADSWRSKLVGHGWTRIHLDRTKNTGPRMHTHDHE
jgi:hypothetical protein